MANTILIRNNTSSATPLSGTFAAVNEMLYNSADGYIYMKDNGGTVHTFKPSSEMIEAIEKGAVNGVATLDGSGKVPQSQLPAIALTDTFVVVDQSAMLALTAETGDVAVRTDENKSYILQGTDPSTLGDWQELLTPTDTVLSVAGKTGAVTLVKADITDFSDGDYATAAQGATADTALQPGDNASNLQITDTYGYYTATDVDGALDEVADALSLRLPEYIVAVAGETISANDVVVFNDTSGKVEKAIATDTGRFYHAITGGNLDDAVYIIDSGSYDGLNFETGQSFDSSKPLYVSASEAGTVTHVDSGSRIFGYALDTANWFTMGGSGITDADQDKLDFISVTQAVDLDDVESKANSALQSIAAGSITETELNASVNASLDLADSALQDGDTLDGGTWS